MVALSKEYLAKTRQDLITQTTDDEAFNKTAQEFLTRAGLELSERPGDHTTATWSSITNTRTYDLDTTTINEYEADRVKSLAAQKVWEGELGLEGRRQFFQIMHDEILPQYEEQFALAISLDTGKTFSDGKGEFAKGREYYGWAASKQVARELSPKMLVTDQLGRKFSRTEDGQYVVREQDGTISVHNDIPEDVAQLHFQVIPAPDALKVIGSMAPSNYAWALEAADEAMRIAGGVLQSKPPSKAPSVIHMLAGTEREALDLMVERGIINAEQSEVLKEGLHTIITGREVTEAWFEEVDVLRAVSEKETGFGFDARRTKAGHLPINTALELGGNNAETIMASYIDPAQAAEDTTRESWKNTGERCTSPRRLFAERDVFGAVETRIREVNEKVWEDPIAAGVGHPLEEGTKYGPLLSEKAFKKLATYKDEVSKRGADAIGGERITVEFLIEKAQNRENVRAEAAGEEPNAIDPKEFEKYAYLDKGFYTTPLTVFWHSVTKDNGAEEDKGFSLPEDVKQIMHDKEVFAHILNVDVVDSVEEAVEKTCRSKEHLSSGFFGSDKDFNDYSEGLYAQDAHPGSLYQNGLPKDGAPTLPHKGSLDGGRGDTGGFHSFIHYTTIPERGSEGTVVKKDRASFTQKFEEEAAKGTQFALG